MGDMQDDVSSELERLAALVDVATAAEKWMVAENARLAAENEKLLAERERLRARLKMLMIAKGIENPN